MEPTNRRETGGRPSPWKRYGPIIAIVAVIAVIGGIVLISNKGDSSSSSTTTSTTGGGGGGNVKSATIINSSNKDSINWGPNCDTSTEQVKIPWTYAAPCVKPLASGENNGGATATGVTADAIKIIVYIGDPRLNPLQAATVKGAGADVDIPSARETYKGYLDMFSKYYEFYGRKLDVEYFVGTGGPMDEVAARNDAATIADKHPFAVLSGANQTPVWSQELAKQHIMCLGNCSLAVPEKTIKATEPYLWGVGPTPDQAGMLTAQMVGKLLNGKKAQYAGSAAIRSKTRVFGVAHYDTIDGQQTEPFQKLKAALTKEGVKIAVDLPFLLDLARAQENARTMIAKLKEAGVTSVIYTGDPLTPSALTKEATAQNYFPEWIIGSNVLVDIAVFGRTYDQTQWKHAFGLALTAARTNQDANQAYALYKWMYGTPPPNNTYGVILADIAPLVLGLQTAGPNLTPESFEAGLFAAPVAGGSPLSPTTSRGNHGLWPTKDYGGSDDTGLIWWNPTARGEDEIGNVGNGLYEYTNGGKRYTLSKLPTTDPGLFKPAGSVTIYTKIPPAFAPPDYPSPAKK